MRTPGSRVLRGRIPSPASITSSNPGSQRSYRRLSITTRSRAGHSCLSGTTGRSATASVLKTWKRSGRHWRGGCVRRGRKTAAPDVSASDRCRHFTVGVGPRGLRATVTERWPPAMVHLSGASVQGDGAVAELVDAIQR